MKPTGNGGSGRVTSTLLYPFDLGVGMKPNGSALEKVIFPGRRDGSWIEIPRGDLATKFQEFNKAFKFLFLQHCCCVFIFVAVVCVSDAQ